MINRPRRFEASCDWRRGFQAALTSAGVICREAGVLDGSWSTATGCQAVHVLLDRRERPSAIFGASDVTALGTIVDLHERQLRVPKDVSVIGFDNRLLASQVQPPLTTVALSLFETGWSRVRRRHHPEWVVSGIMGRAGRHRQGLDGGAGPCVATIDALSCAPARPRQRHRRSRDSERPPSFGRAPLGSAVSRP